jgi:hypothetical protein
MVDPTQGGQEGRANADLLGGVGGAQGTGQVLPRRGHDFFVHIILRSRLSCETCTYEGELDLRRRPKLENAP